MNKTFLNWSGGKDSAYCLYRMQTDGSPVEKLVTALNARTNRISMHGVRSSLLEQQAAALRLPLQMIHLPAQPGMQVYEDVIHESNAVLKAEGFTHAAVGDIFLEDLRNYRIKLYEADGLNCVFPLWKMDSMELMQDFMTKGFRAIVVAVNGSMLDQSFCGRELDADFLNDLPPGVDPCGENGEYHSFVYDGPMFEKPVQFTRGEIILQTYPAPLKDDCYTTPLPPVPFYFLDLFPS